MKESLTQKNTIKIMARISKFVVPEPEEKVMKQAKLLWKT